MRKQIIFFFLCCIFSLSATDNGVILYLDIMKKILVNSIYRDPAMKQKWYGTHMRLRLTPHDVQKRESGRDWPSIAHTMIGLKRLQNIQFCAEEILKNNIPGDFIETGVWRGGSTIFMRAILKAYNVTDRLVWVADSFQGLPKPNPEMYPIDGKFRWDNISFLSVSLPTVKGNFERYNLLDDQVVFLKGWFKDTIPTAPIEKLALLRLDGDTYEATIDVLTHLYPKLSLGGYVIIDDYNLQGCKMAVDDYRNNNNITEPLVDVDGWCVYWKKEK